ncbi:hypothetical protein HID58_093425 [Brassica napus]|uniref:Lon proteolytic domain-containing protein n=1 Tax=Brassica napus TaxID=3708 RepID=A0ABQ7XB08_BRANA|nr:hypothetical protein HID58_093425 [Brassica napus]
MRERDKESENEFMDLGIITSQEAFTTVKEKNIATRRSQMKTIIFLEGNRRDFEELADNVTEGLDVYFVDDYKMIFELAFGYDKQQD